MKHLSNVSGKNYINRAANKFGSGSERRFESAELAVFGSAEFEKYEAATKYLAYFTLNAMR